MKISQQLIVTTKPTKENLIALRNFRNNHRSLRNRPEVAQLHCEIFAMTISHCEIEQKGMCCNARFLQSLEVTVN